jgi:hypothetical protein
MTKILEAHYTNATAAIRSHFGCNGTLSFAVTNNGQRTWLSREEVLALVDAGTKVHMDCIPVAGKKAARTLAEQLGAKPWNF